MMNMPVHSYRMTAVFDPLRISTGENPITLLCDDIIIGESANGLPLPIPPGIAVISLYVMTLPGGTAEPAAFADPPITWMNEISAEAFLVQFWKAAGHVTIMDINTVRLADSHPFQVNIVYNGLPYQQDPVIVNEPPMQPGQG